MGKRLELEDMVTNDGRDRLLSRRRLIRLGFAVPILIPAACSTDEPSTGGSGAGGGTSLPPAPAGPLQATPSCVDADDLTLDQTEGPYFTPGSPENANLRTPDMAGVALILTGSVVDQRCRPISRALLDFWQADAAGEYDNDGFTLRGHQYTANDGAFRLETVVPGNYGNRTRHIHVKAQAPGGPVLTTQLYFPGEPANRTDGIFDSALLMDLADDDGRRRGQFTFVFSRA